VIIECPSEDRRNLLLAAALLATTVCDS
jgi:hypothetical protein